MFPESRSLVGDAVLATELEGQVKLESKYSLACLAHPGSLAALPPGRVRLESLGCARRHSCLCPTRCVCVCVCFSLHVTLFEATKIRGPGVAGAIKKGMSVCQSSAETKSTRQKVKRLQCKIQQFGIADSGFFASLSRSRYDSYARSRPGVSKNQRFQL